MDIRAFSGCWNCAFVDYCDVDNGDLLLRTCSEWEQGEDAIWERRKRANGYMDMDVDSGNNAE